MRAALLLVLAACTGAGKGPDDGGAVDSDSDGADTDDTDAAAETDGSPETDARADDTESPVDTDDTGSVRSARIEVTATADDVWELWIDGRRLRMPDGATAWWEVNTLAATLPGRRHVVAIRARDTQEVVAGLLAEVKVNGDVVARTGAFGFVATGEEPPPGWADLAFDDSAWTPPTPCPAEDASVWGRVTAAHGALLDDGASWVWTRPCREDLGPSWFRVRIGPSAVP